MSHHRRPLKRTESSALLLLAALLAAGLPLAGCQTVPVTPAVKAAPPSSADVQCASNMQDLAGCLLQYFVIYGQLPPKLNALQPVVPLDQKLPLTCPASGQPYVYAPHGLKSPADKRWLILYDAEPSHAGQREAIVATLPEGHTPIGLWVVQLSDDAFMKYIPVPQ